jgi:hypothetical protein
MRHGCLAVDAMRRYFSVMGLRIGGYRDDFPERFQAELNICDRRKIPEICGGWPLDSRRYPTGMSGVSEGLEGEVGKSFK